MPTQVGGLGPAVLFRRVPHRPAPGIAHLGYVHVGVGGPHVDRSHRFRGPHLSGRYVFGAVETGRDVGSAQHSSEVRLQSSPRRQEPRLDQTLLASEQPLRPHRHGQQAQSADLTPRFCRQDTRLPHHKGLARTAPQAPHHRG